MTRLRDDQFTGPFEYPLPTSKAGVKMIWSDAPCWTTCWNGGNTFQDAVRNPDIEFYMIQHIWMENDCNFADLLLPVTTKFEDTDICTDDENGAYNVVFYEENAIAPRGEFLPDCEWISLDDLGGLDFMLPDPEEWPIVSGFFASVIPGYSLLRRVGTYSDIDTLVYTVRAGGCVGFSCGRHASFEPAVEYFPIRGVDTTFAISALWLKDNSKPQLGQFVEALKIERDEWLAERLSTI